MTTTAPTTSTPRAQQGINWPPAIAAIVLLLLLVGGVGYIMWDTSGFAQKNTLNDYERAGDWRGFGQMGSRRFEPPQPVGQFEAPAQGAEQIIKRNEKRYAVMSPGIAADATLNNGNWDLVLRYDDWRVFSPETRQAFGSLLAATERPNEATAAKVTPDQVAKLKALNVRRDMVVSAESKQELSNLWNTYITATSNDDKKKASQPFFDKFREIAKNSLPNTVEAMNKHATDIRAILSQEQIDTLRPNRNRRP